MKEMIFMNEIHFQSTDQQNKIIFQSSEEKMEIKKIQKKR